MKRTPHFSLVFLAALFAAICFHEIGHALGGLLQGIPVVPTPAKEYVLRARVDWQQAVWIAFGGVAATALLGLGALLWYPRARRPWSDAVLAGVLMSPFVYSVRFLLVGRGHDGLEWQAAQSALGVSPSGHAIDVLFLLLTVAGLALWLIRRRAMLRLVIIPQLLAVGFGGLVFVVLLQISNNALFDGVFPESTTINVPDQLDPR